MICMNILTVLSTICTYVNCCLLLQRMKQRNVVLSLLLKEKNCKIKTCSCNGRKSTYTYSNILVKFLVLVVHLEQISVFYLV